MNERSTRWSSVVSVRPRAASTTPAPMVSWKSASSGEVGGAEPDDASTTKLPPTPLESTLRSTDTPSRAKLCCS